MKEVCNKKIVKSERSYISACLPADLKMIDTIGQEMSREIIPDYDVTVKWREFLTMTSLEELSPLTLHGLCFSFF